MTRTPKISPPTEAPMRKDTPTKSQSDADLGTNSLATNDLSKNDLSKNEKRDLKRLAHHLRPVVTVAERGLTDGVRAELERALQDHELIKVKVALADRAQRTELIQQLCTGANASLVTEIGKVAVLYRHNPQAKPHLSNLQRPAPTPSSR